jgi:GT2 family glycosyltransferase
MSLSLLVTSKDGRGLREFMAANMTCLEEVLELNLVIANGHSQAKLGNQFAKRAFSEVVGIVHADTVFGEGDLTRLAKTAEAGNVTGIVGARILHPSESSLAKYVWGTQIKDQTPVSTLDGCAVFFRQDISVSFDPTFEGFHLVVEDFCLQAHRAGVRVVVTPVSARHLEQSTRKAEWQKEYTLWREKLLRKWSGTPFETT